MFKNISKLIMSHGVGQIFKLGEKTAAWKKVRELKAGMRVAVANSSGYSHERPEGVEWDEIVSIKKLPAERVWDIEVKGTHNFVANGIVAHNTSGLLMRAGASSLQLSSSAASTTADIELAAADQIDLFAGRFSLTTSSGTAGDVKIDSAGTFTLSTSRNNTNILFLPGTGNIGIGTTTPNDKLTVAGTAFLGGTSTGLNINAGTITSAYAPGQAGDNEIPIVINAIGASTTSLTLQTGGSDRIKIDANGNVGIGTGTPLGILDAKGDASILLRAGTASLSLSGGTTSTTADLQLAAADKISLFGSSFSLTTSSGSAGDLKLDSAGTLTISTSRNNTNIALMPGSGGVALGISTPAGSATLDISSTSKGFLPPRMTTTQRDNISSPAKGLTIFNDTTNHLNVYNGSAWVDVGPDGVCDGSYDCRITLSAEYPGAIISADGSNNVGTITSDLTISASNYYYNYYEFSSGQASQQDYDVYIRWQLPLGWADWDDAANAIEIDLATESSTSTDSKVDATIYREGDADSYSATAKVSPTGGEWRTIQEGKSVLSITKTNLNTVQNPWVAGDVLVIKLKLYSKDNYYARVGNIRITYENQ